MEIGPPSEDSSSENQVNAVATEQAWQLTLPDPLAPAPISAHSQRVEEARVQPAQGHAEAEARELLLRLHRAVRGLKMQDEVAGVLLRRAKLEEAHEQYNLAVPLYLECVHAWDAIQATQHWQQDRQGFDGRLR